MDGDEDEIDIVNTAIHEEQAVLSMCTDTRGSRYKRASMSICQNLWNIVHNPQPGGRNAT